MKIVPTVFIALAHAVLGVGIYARAAHAQTFTAIGTLSGTIDSRASGVSADGSVVVGMSHGRAYRWTSAGGMIDLGVLSGANESYGQCVSADGLVVAGYSGTGGVQRPFRWAMAGGLSGLGLLPGGSGAFCYGMSADGSIIVGYGDSVDAQTGGHQDLAIIWNSGGAPQSLGLLPGSFASAAYAVSADGSTIVGRVRVSSNGFPPEESLAFKRTPGGGMVSLGMLPGATYSGAYGVNVDGSVIVGQSGNDDPANMLMYQQAVRWTPTGGIEALASIDASAGSVSADGTRIVGYLGNPRWLLPTRAMLWTRELGARDLNGYLVALGVDLTGWTLEEVAAITPDGRTIVGNGLHNDMYEAWLATLPAVLPVVPDPCFVVSGPENARVCVPGAAVTFSVSAPVATGPYTYRWEINQSGTWVTLSHDPVAVGCVTGSGTGAAYASQPTSASTSISIQACPGVRPYLIRAVVTNACGSIASNQAVYGFCRADFNCSGSLEVADIFLFLDAWFSGDPRADFNGGGLAVTDVYAFLFAWFDGC